MYKGGTTVSLTEARYHDQCLYCIYIYIYMYIYIDFKKKALFNKLKYRFLIGKMCICVLWVCCAAQIYIYV
jgi:hypothetical protein